MQSIMSVISGADTTSIKILTGRLDFGQKRDTLLDMLQHSCRPQEQIHRIQQHLAPPHTYARLRNDIAHSTWIASQSANVIYPAWLSHGSVHAIKAQRILDQDDKFSETYADQHSYTLDDLQDILDRLTTNLDAFDSYARDVSLTSAP